MRAWVALVFVALVPACARGLSDGYSDPNAGPSGGGAPGPGAGGDASATDGGTSASPDTGSPGSADATSPEDAPAGGDSAPPPPPPDDSGSGGLDPGLSLPDPSGQPCTLPGSENGCPLTSVCRISSTTGGRCESCTDCGHLHDPCAATADCDIVFECYQGFCTNFCTPGTSECGAVADCVNVGNATTGVCKP